MELQQFIENGERAVRSVRHDDGRAIVADLGPDASDAVVDVVDETAIVVQDGEAFDVELPGAAERAFIRNGVLTIELEADE